VRRLGNRKMKSLVLMQMLLLLLPLLLLLLLFLSMHKQSFTNAMILDLPFVFFPCRRLVKNYQPKKKEEEDNE